MKLDGKLQRQFKVLAWHRFVNVSQPLVATIAFLAGRKWNADSGSHVARRCRNWHQGLPSLFKQGACLCFLKKEAANLRRWFGDDPEQWAGKQVQIRPVVRVAVAGMEFCKPWLSAVSVCFLRDHIPVAIFQMKRPTVAPHLRCMTQRPVFLNL